MMNLQARFLQTYFLGEGLSGFLPSIIGIIQGVGKTTCNGTEPHYHEPNFGIGTFWIIMSSLMLLSLISFVAMNLKFQKYFVKYESSTISDSVASSGEILTLVRKGTNYLSSFAIKGFSKAKLASIINH